MNSGKDDDRQFPITVSLTAMSDQTRAQIEYYIEHSKNRCFASLPEGEVPDVVIIDYDHPGTTSRLINNEWESDIILVILATATRPVDGAIMVSKPLDSAGLEKAADIALARLNGHVVAVEGDDSADYFENDQTDFEGILAEGQAPPKLTRRTDYYRPDGSDTPAYFRTTDAALPGPPTLSMLMRIQRYRDKIDLLCGPSRTLDQLRDPNDTEHRYDPAHCLSEQVSQVLFNSHPDIKAVHIQLPESELYVLPTLNKVYTSISLEYKRNVELLFRDWSDNEVQIFEYDTSNVNKVIDILNQSTRYSFSSQSFCWLGSLFSKQGRLPIGMDIDSPFQLLHWPNITRLELIPDCLEISAAWTGKVATLSDIVNQVRCEPRHAVSFMNAAHAIKLLVDANNNDSH